MIAAIATILAIVTIVNDHMETRFYLLSLILKNTWTCSLKLGLHVRFIAAYHSIQTCSLTFHCLEIYTMT